MRKFASDLFIYFPKCTPFAYLNTLFDLLGGKTGRPDVITTCFDVCDLSGDAYFGSLKNAQNTVNFTFERKMALIGPPNVGYG